MILHLLAAVLLAPAAAAGPKELPVKDERSDFFGEARYAAPPGWQEEKSAAPEPSVRLSKGGDVIKLRLLGGKGSRYKAPADYIQGFEATTMGKPPERLAARQVSGLKVWLYRHGYPIELGDPGAASAAPPLLAREEFLIVPFGKRFFVLSWAEETPVPDPDSSSEKTWQAFLESFSIRKP